jgi:hypothetical protein
VTIKWWYTWYAWCIDGIQIIRNFGLVNMGSLLWREIGYVVYNCCLSSPAQSSLSPSPTRLMTKIYCFRFEISSTWRLKSPYLRTRTTGWPRYTCRHWVLFTTPRATMEVLDLTHESCGIRTREWLCWRGPAANANYRPVLSSERANHINKHVKI